MDTIRDEVPVVHTLDRSALRGTLEKLQSSMRRNPAKWAGIAAGSGFAVGLLGRISQMRSARKSRMPQLGILESC